MAKDSKVPSRAPLPSAHDVARSAGVGQATVSRAFTAGASISPAVKARVMQAADELGYRPNLLARSLIMGRSRIVGVVMGDPRNSFYVAALSCLSRRLAAADLHMLVYISEGSETSDVPVQDLLKYRVDALVLMSAHLSSGLAAACQAEGIPVIFFNRWSRNATAIGSVTGANDEGGRRIAAHLLDQGYRRLAFMAGIADTSTSRDRERGFMAYCDEQRADRPVRVVGQFDRDCARAAMRGLLSSSPAPDAVFCANDVMAIASIEIARHEFGLQVGKDIGIAGYDDIEQAAWPSFELTSYSQPVPQMIDGVMEMLSAPSHDHIVVHGSLVVRSSSLKQ